MSILNTKGELQAPVARFASSLARSTFWTLLVTFALFASAIEATRACASALLGRIVTVSFLGLVRHGKSHRRIC